MVERERKRDKTQEKKTNFDRKKKKAYDNEENLETLRTRSRSNSLSSGGLTVLGKNKLLKSRLHGDVKYSLNDCYHLRQKWLSLLLKTKVFSGNPKKWRVSTYNIDKVFEVLKLNNKKSQFRSSIVNFTLKQKREISFTSFCRAYEQ